MRLVRSTVGLASMGVLAILGMGLAFTGAPSAHAADSAFVRVVHAAPAAPQVDVYVDNTKLLPDFKFGAVTDYVPLAAGQHEIDVTPTGKTVADAVIKQQVTVTSGTTYTVAAIGDSATKPALVAFVDDNSIATGKAKVRVYHLSSDAGPVAVATGGQTVIGDLAFQKASDYLAVAPGAYTFDVTLKNSNKTVQLPATLAVHKVTSVFALGLAAGSGDTALKFATAVVAGVPNGLPQTGFNPSTTPKSETPLALYAALAALGLLVVGGSSVAVARRRAR